MHHAAVSISVMRYINPWGPTKNPNLKFKSGCRTRVTYKVENKCGEKNGLFFLLGCNIACIAKNWAKVNKHRHNPLLSNFCYNYRCALWLKTSERHIGEGGGWLKTRWPARISTLVFSFFYAHKTGNYRGFITYPWLDQLVVLIRHQNVPHCSTFVVVLISLKSKYVLSGCQNYKND